MDLDDLINDLEDGTNDPVEKEPIEGELVSDDEDDNLDDLLNDDMEEAPLAKPNKKKASKKKANKKKASKKTATKADPEPKAQTQAAPETEKPAPKKKKKRRARKASTGDSVLGTLAEGLASIQEDINAKQRATQVKVDLRNAKAELAALTKFQTQVGKLVTAAEANVAKLEDQLADD